MKELIRIVLVDPNEESRRTLQRLLGTLGHSGSPRSSASYREAAEPDRGDRTRPLPGEPRPEPDPGRRSDRQPCRANPEAVVLPASANSDSTLILKAIRAGPASSSPSPPRRAR